MSQFKTYAACPFSTPPIGSKWSLSGGDTFVVTGHAELNDPRFRNSRHLWVVPIKYNQAPAIAHGKYIMRLSSFDPKIGIKRIS